MTPEQFMALGEGSKAKAAWETKYPDKKWSKTVSSDIRSQAKIKHPRQVAATQKYQDWTTGSSGYTDIYRQGKTGEIKGPEYGIPDVDIYGYPKDWNVEYGDDRMAITPKGGKTYYKPTGGGGGGDGVTTGGGGGVVNMAIQPFDLPSLTSEMDFSNAIASFINKDSPLFKAAGNAAMQRMAKRGLGIVNSSIAFGEVERAIIDVSTGIMKVEIDNLIANLNKRTEWTNAQRKQANDYVYERLAAKIDAAATWQLEKMKGRGALAEQRVSALGELAGRTDIPVGRWNKFIEALQGMTPQSTVETTTV